MHLKKIVLGYGSVSTADGFSHSCVEDQSYNKTIKTLGDH